MRQRKARGWFVSAESFNSVHYKNRRQDLYAVFYSPVMSGVCNWAQSTVLINQFESRLLKEPFNQI